ncbi:hypothetical protein [Asticcacaulis sp.]|uniref:hypothetical protein n=1 Tax=Asticcacaulis sp. TaxID=1872648 RepID=UPI0026027774|nr:hypothetical protein [Asticcacaulis sp.]
MENEEAIESWIDLGIMKEVAKGKLNKPEANANFYKLYVRHYKEHGRDITHYFIEKYIDELYKNKIKPAYDYGIDMYRTNRPHHARRVEEITGYVDPQYRAADGTFIDKFIYL